MNSKPFTKINKRHNGYGHFMYYLNRPKTYSISSNKLLSLYETTQYFFKWREYCWNIYGPSKEINNWLADIESNGTIDKLATHHNEFWSWQNNEYGTKIYLKSDKELSAFLLVWF